MMNTLSNIDAQKRVPYSFKAKRLSCLGFESRFFRGPLGLSEGSELLLGSNVVRCLNLHQNWVALKGFLGDFALNFCFFKISRLF